MSIPIVVLIGGPPYVGKSAVARCIAARYEYGCLSTDDLAKAVGSAHLALTGKSPDPMDGLDWREYFAATPVDALLDHAAASRERIWPAVDRIVRAHYTRHDPLVIEGYALWPEQVMAAGLPGTGAVWLCADDHLLEARIRADPGFYRGAADEEALIGNMTRRSSRYRERMLRSAAKCGAAVVSVPAGQSVAQIAERCVCALTASG